ncbi:MAG: hypothetical protein IJT51_10470 [Bacteroidales bacterium]|nr:hypothetical protein [Bacteroidales bacterium]
MIRIKVSCPKCGRRVMDKTENAKGIIEIKCPHCRSIVKIQLDQSNDGSIRYRLVS